MSFRLYFFALSLHLRHHRFKGRTMKQHFTPLIFSFLTFIAASAQIQDYQTRGDSAKATLAAAIAVCAVAIALSGLHSLFGYVNRAHHFASRALPETRTTEGICAYFDQAFPGLFR